MSQLNKKPNHFKNDQKEIKISLKNTKLYKNYCKQKIEKKLSRSFYQKPLPSQTDSLLKNKSNNKLSNKTRPKIKLTTTRNNNSLSNIREPAVTWYPQIAYGSKKNELITKDKILFKNNNDNENYETHFILKSSLSNYDSTFNQPNNNIIEKTISDLVNDSKNPFKKIDNSTYHVNKTFKNNSLRNIIYPIRNNNYPFNNTLPTNLKKSNKFLFPLLSTSPNLRNLQNKTLKTYRKSGINFTFDKSNNNNGSSIDLLSPLLIHNLNCNKIPLVNNKKFQTQSGLETPHNCIKTQKKITKLSNYCLKNKRDSSFTKKTKIIKRKSYSMEKRNRSNTWSAYEEKVSNTDTFATVIKKENDIGGRIDLFFEERLNRKIITDNNDILDNNYIGIIDLSPKDNKIRLIKLIQKFWRKYKNKKKILAGVLLIQRYYRNYLLCKKLNSMVKLKPNDNKNKNEELLRAPLREKEYLCENFITEYKSIPKIKKVVKYNKISFFTKLIFVNSIAKISFLQKKIRKYLLIKRKKEKNQSFIYLKKNITERNSVRSSLKSCNRISCKSSAPKIVKTISFYRNDAFSFNSKKLFMKLPIQKNNCFFNKTFISINNRCSNEANISMRKNSLFELDQSLPPFAKINKMMDEINNKNNFIVQSHETQLIFNHIEPNQKFMHKLPLIAICYFSKSYYKIPDKNEIIKIPLIENNFISKKRKKVISDKKIIFLQKFIRNKISIKKSLSEKEIKNSKILLPLCFISKERKSYFDPTQIALVQRKFRLYLKQKKLYFKQIKTNRTDPRRIEKKAKSSRLEIYNTYNRSYENIILEKDKDITNFSFGESEILEQLKKSQINDCNGPINHIMLNKNSNLHTINIDSLPTIRTNGTNNDTLSYENQINNFCFNNTIQTLESKDSSYINEKILFHLFIHRLIIKKIIYIFTTTVFHRWYFILLMRDLIFRIKTNNFHFIISILHNNAIDNQNKKIIEIIKRHINIYYKYKEKNNNNEVINLIKSIIPEYFDLNNQNFLFVQEIPYIKKYQESIIMKTQLFIDKDIELFNYLKICFETEHPSLRVNNDMLKRYFSQLLPLDDRSLVSLTNYIDKLYKFISDKLEIMKLTRNSKKIEKDKNNINKIKFNTTYEKDNKINRYSENIYDSDKNDENSMKCANTIDKYFKRNIKYVIKKRTKDKDINNEDDIDIFEKMSEGTSSIINRTRINKAYNEITFMKNKRKYSLKTERKEITPIGPIALKSRNINDLGIKKLNNFKTYRRVEKRTNRENVNQIHNIRNKNKMPTGNKI